MRQVEVDGVAVHYVEHGPPDAARTAVMLHGFTADHQMMTACLEPMFAQRRGWRRIYLDLPGMGRTPAPPRIDSTDAVFEVVRRAVAALTEREHVLIGCSYGGAMARGLVAADPDRVSGLALICPGVVFEIERRDLPAAQVISRDDALVAELQPAEAEEFLPAAVVQQRAEWGRFRDEVLSGAALADPASLQRIRQRYAPTFPVESRVFERPTVILTGRQDAVAGYADPWRLLRHYPRATFAVLDRAGHHLQIEQPTIFETMISEWLDRVEEAGSRG
ncbi:MAG: alpha/beta fold hydrolase [Micromonosporaceae bacterium]